MAKEAATKAPKAPKAPKASKAKAESAKRDVFRMADDGVIGFGKDGEGKDYGPDNSPKRGDKTKDLWGKYKPGMTVKQALDKGFTRSNIRRDRRAGYITITNPASAAE
jgi:hypothetical protein